MAMTDWTGPDARQLGRNRTDDQTIASENASGIVPRAIALAIDYVILLMACAGLSGVLGLTNLSEETRQTLAALLSFALIAVYFATLESGSLQATLGKRLLGLKVISDEGDRISFARALGRFFGKLLSLIPFGVGFVMAAFTDGNRALHDMLAGTLVVRIQEPAIRSQSAGKPTL